MVGLFLGVVLLILAGAIVARVVRAVTSPLPTNVRGDTDCAREGRAG